MPFVPLLCALALLPTALILLRVRAWPFLLLFPFRAQYAVGYVLLMGLLLAVRAWPWALLMALAALYHGVHLRPYLLRARRNEEQGSPSGLVLRLFEANVLSSNRRRAPLLHLLEQVDPDIVVLIEVNRAWLEGLRALDERYPHRMVGFGRGRYAVALWTRVPVARMELCDWGEPRRPGIVATLELAGEQVELYVIHPEAPPFPWKAASQRRQLQAVARTIAGAEQPVLLVGDLNATPWCPAWGEFRQAARLVDPRRGRGLLPTWPAWGWPFRIPIDHILHSVHFHVRSLARLGDIGSDHFPLLAELELRVGD